MSDPLEQGKVQLDVVTDEQFVIEAKLAKHDALMQAGFAEYERRLAKAVEASVDAVWTEYTDSIESKWTFRKEHVQNAILRTLAELKGEDRG